MEIMAAVHLIDHAVLQIKVPVILSPQALDYQVAKGVFGAENVEQVKRRMRGNGARTHSRGNVAAISLACSAGTRSCVSAYGALAATRFLADANPRPDIDLPR